MGFFLALPSWPGEDDEPAASPATIGSTPGRSVMSVRVEFPMPACCCWKERVNSCQRGAMAGSDSHEKSKILKNSQARQLA